MAHPQTSTGASRVGLLQLLILAITFCANRAAADNIYAPFSGAIYIIGADGYQITGASPAVCPNYASESCNSIGYWNWCCPAGHTCSYLSNSNVVGCCPAGSSCSGGVAPGSITTVTVTVYNTATTTVVQNIAPAYVAPTTTQVVPQWGGYCATITANGPDLPTTRAGDCGTILVINEGVGKNVGKRIAVLVGLMHLLGWG
ncbi:uncharacterized protein K452DRAFT_291480 [Aplosporella prunicola CBS 121167]|uniref:Uncharacterized protein n=1 Tax=Aplosporella prunicola CBS 121167 TaxID=1176127 RepID=A0A6A6B335_9PEZI|nr:uncharacterized protein K452DRAFT_291480 [Aplosporella prunicola CBS 121167]KAF2137665.1 hypothetical protein K452DRAFT_291480 [Aplosporella prunicola CBS 121167]